jgi:hypothetical protein
VEKETINNIYKNIFLFLLLAAVLSLASYSVYSRGSNNGLPQASAETVLLEDDFNSENGGVGQLFYFGFANWLVTDGSVDLIGNGFFDFYPGNGLYVDLDGSITYDAGKLTSKKEFTLTPGTYELKFDLGNNADPQQPISASFNKMTVRLGTVYSEEFARQGLNNPLTTITRKISVSEPTSGKLSFDHAGGDVYGLIIDNVKLSFITAAAADITPPVITVPSDITEEATGPDGATVSFEVSAKDNVDGAVPVSCDHKSGDTFPIGKTVVTCTAKDSAGNTAQKSFTITVQDTTAPNVQITKAVDKKGVQITEGNTTKSHYIQITFKATDAVGVKNTQCSLDGQAFTSCTSPVVYDQLKKGTHTVTVRAVDAAGNTGQAQFSWTVNPAEAAKIR